ncbi:MAG: hypothetical protein ACMZ66_05335 [Thalassospira sp.]|uniref:hypothetical protein n=1 Tax=Thalassospira sp. TaxID=1912094 RepID=UPI003A88F305
MAGNIPQPVSANVRVPVEAAAQSGRANTAIAQGVAALAGSAEQAGNRIQTRREAVDLTRAIRGFEEQARGEYRRLLTEGDFSDPTVAENYTVQLRDTQDQLLNDWQGSPESKVRLFERLDGIRSQLTDQAAVTQIAEGRRIVANQLDGTTRELADAAYNDPGAMVGLFERLDEELADMGPALTQEDFLSAQEAGRQNIIVGAATSLLDRGDVDGAEEILSVPGVLENLDAGTSRRIRSRVASQRIELDKAARAGMAKIEEFRAIMGRDPDASERLRIAGISTTGGKTLPQKVSEFESVVGRPATEAEVQKMAGADVDTGGFGFGKGLSGIALANLTNGSAAFAAGMMTPEQERNFESSVVGYMTPQRDPDTGSITQPILPPHVVDALNQRGYEWDINTGNLIRPGGQPVNATGQGGAMSPQQAMAQQMQPSLQEVDPEKTAWSLADKVTGVGPAAVDFLGRLPVVGENFDDPQITQARAYIPNLQRDLVRVLQNNPRYAEGERQAIEQEINIDGRLIDNPEAYRNRLIGIDDALQKRQDFAYKTANNPQVGREERIQAMNILNALANFRQNLGVPTRVKTAQDWQNVLAGQQYIDPNGVIRVKGGENGNQ